MKGKNSGGRPKRKKCSSEHGNSVEDSSLGEGAGDTKRTRSESHSRQPTLTTLLGSGVEKMASKDGNTTFTAEKDGGSHGILEQLSNLEKALTDKFQSLKNRVDVSETRLAEHISDQVDSFAATFLPSNRKMTI